MGFSERKPVLLPLDGEKEVNRTEAARLLKVSLPTMRKLKIPFRQYTHQGTVHYKLSDLYRFIELRSFNIK